MARTRPAARLRTIVASSVISALMLPAALLSQQASARAADSALLISQDRPTQASSVENNGTPANAVNDADPASRWSSKASDPQWVQIDLRRTAQIERVRLVWQSAYARAFRLQVSPDQVRWTTIYSTATSTGGTQILDVKGSGRYIRMLGLARATPYGYSLMEFEVYGTVPRPTGTYVAADQPVTGVAPSRATPPPTGFHEFQANCSVTRNVPDDPIVYPGKPGAAHLHTFMGNTTTDAHSTRASLARGGTSCKAPGDRSAYWMPSLYDGTRVVQPIGPQVIYYKSGVRDYKSVRPFPEGLRFVVGDPHATPAQFLAASVAGWECGNTDGIADFPGTCPTGTRLNLRYQAPSCWDGQHLDTPDHQEHMAYPVDGRCTAKHPVALPMIEFKMAWPVDGDLSRVRLSSGRGYSFHYDFYNAWDARTQAALVRHCINGGMQCDARGYDQTKPARGAALGTDYRLR